MGSIGANRNFSTGLRRLDNGRVDQTYMEFPSDMPDISKLSDYDRELVEDLFQQKRGGVYSEFPAMERFIEELSNSTDKRARENTVRGHFNTYAEGVRETANYEIDNKEMTDYLNKKLASYEERFEKALQSWKKNIGRK